ncbi:unnamed protein product [Closterium sp. Naga37s-1]|nr:unnamed protein product [Closterium sp. Naga37s-1]
MVERGALCRTGGALLDTGIYAVCGDTWRDLIGLATSEEDLLAELLASGEEVSGWAEAKEHVVMVAGAGTFFLYEELAAAWVPARHAWLSTRPLGPQLLAHLSSHSIFHHCSDDLSFLHFGTSSEYLHHMRLAYTGRMPRRHLSAVAAPTDCHVAQSAALISSHVPPGACVGEGSVVSDSWLVRGTRIGDRCVVIGVDTAAAAAAAESASATLASATSAGAADAATAESASSGSPTPIVTSFCPLVLPSHMCLWQVPLKGGREVTLCCGVDDNPKLSFSGGGSFCGRPWKLWLKDRGLTATDIWPDTDKLGRPIQPKQDLWNALLFPILPSGSGLPLAMWLLGSFPSTITQASNHTPSQAVSQQYADTTSAAAAAATAAGGSLGRNLASLTRQLLLADVVDAHTSTCHVGESHKSANATSNNTDGGGNASGDGVNSTGRGRMRGAGELCRELAASFPSVGGREAMGLSQNRRAGEDGGKGVEVGGDKVVGVSGEKGVGEGGNEREQGQTRHLQEQQQWAGVPMSRVLQAKLDLVRAVRGVQSEGLRGVRRVRGEGEVERGAEREGEGKEGEEGEGEREREGEKEGGEEEELEEGVWRAVAEEAAVAVGMGGDGRDDEFDSPQDSTQKQAALTLGATVTVTLPVRLDIAGGWRDTPPWCDLVPTQLYASLSPLSTASTLFSPIPTTPAALPLGATVTVTLPVRLDIAGGWSNTPPWTALPLGTTVTVTLPVRLDIAGGWSDTPPWSLERCGTVLNMAVLLEGRRPVGATVTVVKEPGVLMEDGHGASFHITDPATIFHHPVHDSLTGNSNLQTSSLFLGIGVLMEDDLGASLHIPDPATIPTHLSPQGPFVIVKAALLVTRISTLLFSSSSSSSRVGLHIRTWADVPRGSGLGTSSIVAAALVRALLVLIRGGGRGRTVGESSLAAEEAPDATEGAPGAAEKTPEEAPGATEKAPEEAPEVTDEEVSRLVLLLEQRMGTGGGWQDQVGGLYPGVKCTSSLPTRPIRLVVDPLPLLPAFRSALQQRLVVVFVGQVRLARNVLKNVVTRYLQRDSRLISAIQWLTDLAEIGRRAISTADLDLLGRVLSHTWDLHQELDPHCSNPHVDTLLAAVEHLSCGAKLAGAGGGGFAMIMGRSEEAAEEIKGILSRMGEPVRVYDWAVAV